MPKALDRMTAAELKRAYDKASDVTSKLCTALVESGRDMERSSEIRMKSDPLSLDYTRENDRFYAIVNEIEVRKRGAQRIIRKQ